MSSRLSTSNEQKIASLIEERALFAVFQPIVDFESGGILGYEGLIRGPADTSLESPGALFAQAAREGMSVELELAAAALCAAAFAEFRTEGKLFLNFSAEAITSIGRTREHATRWLGRQHTARAHRARTYRAMRDRRCSRL